MSSDTIRLSNELLAITVSPHGAELKSILELATGTEYLWQADKTYWGRSAPILFPIVGKLIGDQYAIDHATYKMTQHGFARDSLFTPMEQAPERAVLKLGSNSSTKEMYPFDFDLSVQYELQSNALVISYLVTNTGHNRMYFSLGSHPAFNVPFGKGSYSDYFVEFEETESVGCHYLEEGLQSGKASAILNENKFLPLSDTLFDKDALLFKDFKSKRIHLKNHIDEKQITVSTGGAPYLGIWSKPRGAPFVCIEPWFGIADNVDGDGNLKNKEGIVILDPQKIFRTSYSITIK